MKEEILRIISKAIEPLKIGMFDNPKLMMVSEVSAGIIAKLLVWGYKIRKIPTESTIYIGKRWRAGVWGDSFRSVEIKPINFNFFTTEDGKKITKVNIEERGATIKVEAGQIFAIDVHEQNYNDRLERKISESHSEVIIIGVPNGKPIHTAY